MSRIVSFSGRRCAVRIARGLGRCRDLRLVGVVMTFGVFMILGGFMSLGVYLIVGENLIGSGRQLHLVGWLLHLVGWLL
ncbi:MAG: hypothetical protein ACXWNF_11075, partial [Isosphaeraceae bacterium]